MLLPEGDECHDKLQDAKYDRDDDFGGCACYTHGTRLGNIYLFVVAR